jgi:hypothetical protein
MAKYVCDPRGSELSDDRALNALIDEIALALPDCGVSVDDMLMDEQGDWFAVLWSPATGRMIVDLPCTRDDLISTYAENISAGF